MKAIVNNSCCQILYREKLPRKTVGKTIEVEFSADWEGLAITAVFEAGDVKKDVVYTGKPIIIPHEVLVTEGLSVMLGFHGALPDGTIVKRTVPEWLNNVGASLDPSGETSSEPTPDWAAQVQTIALKAKEAADSVRRDADAGKFNGAAGGWYTPAVTQPDENTLRVAFTPSKENMPAVAETDITLPAGGGGGGSSIAIDETLTKSGQAADAKTVGDRLDSLSEEIVTTSESKVAAHNTGTDTHSDIRLLIQGLTDRLNALADSDDTTLDQLSEVVAYIKSNRTLIEAITTSKVSVADIVDNLTTNVSNKPLSAAQGVVIKTLIDALSNDKLDAAELTNAVNTALAHAKASGEFDGAVGAPGKDGADGEPGEYGTDGYSPTANVMQNDNGATITITDKNGTTIATIKNGKDGADGAPGKDGADGSPGKDGQPGKDGVGIQSVVQTTTSTADGGDNVFTVTLTNGTSATFTVKNGRTGSTGAPGADGSPGKNGTSATHSWNGAVLTITSASGTSSADLKGEKGEKGDRGDTGAQGPKGEKGDTGAQGPQGPQGEQGPKGDTGDIGPQGPKGGTGATGADGKSAYSYAQDGGYAGTEEEFAAKLAAESIDKALFVVNITRNSGGTDSADKTFEEIVQAYNEGKYNIVAHVVTGGAPFIIPL